MSKELLCAIMLIIFFGVMVYVGFYSRKHAKDVNGFVLGGRGVGPVSYTHLDVYKRQIMGRTFYKRDGSTCLQF